MTVHSGGKRTAIILSDLVAASSVQDAKTWARKAVVEGRAVGTSVLAMSRLRRVRAGATRTRSLRVTVFFLRVFAMWRLRLVREIAKVIRAVLCTNHNLLELVGLVSVLVGVQELGKAPCAGRDGQKGQ